MLLNKRKFCQSIGDQASGETGRIRLPLSAFRTIHPHSSSHPHPG